MDAVDEVLALYRTGGSKPYSGDGVTYLQHALQTAHRAREGEAGDEAILGALLHDIGDLLGEAVDAAGWLRERGFGKCVITLVTGHVAAKRYLATVKPGYHDQLAEASKRTLASQGGRMTVAEVQAFEQRDAYYDLLRLSIWDDMARAPHLEVAGLDSYRELIEAHLKR